MRDVGSSLKEAEQGIHGAFDKLRHKNPDAASALPAPALPAETAAAALPAAAPVVLKGLEAIKAELEKLVTAHGGFGQLAADGVQMIEGAIADPKMEGAVVLADLAKVIAQMVSDLVLHAPSAPAPAEAAPDHA